MQRRDVRTKPGRCSRHGDVSTASLKARRWLPSVTHGSHSESAAMRLHSKRHSAEAGTLHRPTLHEP